MTRAKRCGGQSAPRSLGIRHKLMLFLCLMSVVTLGLVGLLLSQFLQPQYNRYIQNQLSQRLNALVGLVEQNDQDISTRSVMGLELDPDFWFALNDAMSSGALNLHNCCVEISDQTLSRVYTIENMYPCLLHKVDRTVTGKVETQDTDDVLRLRAELFQTGSLSRILLTSSGTRQMVVGRLARGGRYAIMVSTSLAQVEEARMVMGRLLPFVAAALMALSVAGAWLFSRWFTRPLSHLSAAARQMAEGNYDVRVPTESGDEIGRLAQDFNHMAGEVARASQLQRDLLANVSHDLRTPLTLIKGYAETVRDLTGDDPAKRTDQLNVIVDETDRLSGLVNSVMELSKVSSGTDRPNPVNFDMAQLCEEVAERYEAVCAQSGYTLVVQAPQPCPVHADPAMMERVLHNLLGNALHHIGQDGAFILRATPCADGVRVEVEDHGPGIPPEELPYLFDRYYRSRKDAGKPGTGLGLSITKAILQSHGFRFGVQSTLGQGTVFWFVMGPWPQPPAKSHRPHGAGHTPVAPQGKATAGAGATAGGITPAEGTAPTEESTEAGPTSRAPACPRDEGAAPAEEEACPGEDGHAPTPPPGS